MLRPQKSQLLPIILLQEQDCPEIRREVGIILIETFIYDKRELKFACEFYRMITHNLIPKKS